jgi:hypothetical protein
MIMTADVAAPVPLWLLYEDEVDALALADAEAQAIRGVYCYLLERYGTV